MLRADAVIGDHATNAALAATHAAVCDRAHTNGAKVVYALNLTTAEGAPAGADDVARAIAGLQGGGVEPDAWVLDQPAPNDATAITEQAHSGGREPRGSRAPGREPCGRRNIRRRPGRVGHRRDRPRCTATDQIAAAVTAAVASLVDA